MKTLADDVLTKLSSRNVQPLTDLLRSYDDEKDPAKCFSTLAYLSCIGAGGSRELGGIIARLIEAFFLGTSLHDDFLDREDSLVKETLKSSTPNAYMVLGDCFFVQMAVALGEASPHIPENRRVAAISKFETYLFDVAQAQIFDEQSQGNVPSTEAAVQQMKIRGGTWGRLCTEFPALAGGLEETEAAKLGQSGEDMFLAMTIRDDLRDLPDDLSNGIHTYAPALYFEALGHSENGDSKSILKNGGGTNRQSVMRDDQSNSELIEQMHAAGVIELALNKTREYASRGLRGLNEFLRDKDAMEWFLLQMVFRLMEKRFAEFTPDHVRKGLLGIGFATDQEIGKAILRL